MGKSRNKKLKQSPEAVQPPSPDDVDQDLATSVKAIDGHNTNGWTDNEVKAYNELIVERQKLEKQRHELEEKCVKSQTQRALLHENVADIDNLFKQPNPMLGTFRFIGASSCCVDFDAAVDCHHDICKRARTDGISDLELDTIKYYSMRIHHEKSDRIKKALRKQRDLEFIRIREEEEENLAQSARKLSKIPKPSFNETNKLGGRGAKSKDISKAAKETEKIVNRIINQLDDLRADLQTGRISAEEAQGKLNMLDSKLPAMQNKASHKTHMDGGYSTMNSLDIKSSTESFQNQLRERLITAKGDTFSQAFSIMDHFLSATKPDDLQEAISELRDILQLSGPMCDELQSSLGALEGIFDNPDKLSFTGPDGKQECNSIIDLMEKLKETLKRTGQLPDGANASLTKVFQDCIDLEAEAKEHLTRKCTDESTTSTDLPTALFKIKDEYVSKSPIPPLTSNKLDADIANLLDVYDARQLLAKARSVAEAIELEAQITSLVILRTQKQSAKYIEKLERLDIACRSAGAQEGWDKVRESIANVSNKMKKWIPASDTKKTQTDASSSMVNDRASAEAESATAFKETQTVKVAGEALSSNATAKELAKEAQQVLRSSVKQSGKHGLWDTFELYAQKTTFECDTAILDKAQSYTEKARAMIEDQAYGVQATICYLYKLKLCPAMVAAIAAQALLEVANNSENDSRIYLQEFAGCIDGLPSSVSTQWSARFQHIALAMVQLYTATYIESMVIFPKLPPLQLAFSMVEIVTKFVLLTRSTQASHENTRILTGFLLMCFGRDAFSFEAAMAHYEYFCVNDEFRCLTVSICSKHMSFAQMPFNPITKHARKVLKQSQDHSRPSRVLQASSKDATIPTNAELDSDIPMSQRMIKQKVEPMKTRVVYPPNYQSKQCSNSMAHLRAVQYSECLRKAEILYDSVARKSYAHLMLKIDKCNQPVEPDPTEFIAAMFNVSDYLEDKYAHLEEGFAKVELDNTSTNSRFSEHLDEPQSSNNLSLRSIAYIQRIFRQVRCRTLGAKYLRSFKVDLKKRVLSGEYPDPIETITKHANPLLKLGHVPRSFAKAIIKAQIELQDTLNKVEERSTFKTKRLEYLLKIVGAQEPNATALFKLAVEAPTAFHEYYDIVLDKLKAMDTSAVKALEQAWVDISELHKTLELQEDSSSLETFAQFAMNIWRERPQHTVEAPLKPKECPPEEHEKKDLSTLIVSSFSQLNDRPAQIAQSIAKQPVIEAQSTIPSEAPSRASIVSPDQLAKKMANDEEDDESSLAARRDESPDGTNSRVEIPISAVKEIRADDPKGSMLETQLTSSMNAAKELLHSITTEPIGTIGGENRSPEFQGYETRYLLPDDGISGDDRSTSNNSTTSPSTPVSFRMLDMMKHLGALQKSSRETFQTAKEINELNKEHGGRIVGVAEKLATQVSTCTDFIEQIAKWNGIELEKEAFAAKQRDKGSRHPKKL